MNIYLIGFMGVGKSTVAKMLSDKLDFELIDTDIEIEKRENRSINEIFSQNGEEYFREKEKELIEELSKKDNMIISCGGGIIKSDVNIANMKKSGSVVLLEASPEIIYNRVKDDNNRPLLVSNPGIEGIKKLMKEREESYNKAFTHKVDASKTPVQVVNDIITATLTLGDEFGNIN
ncbi:MAG: shikimate kinase [Lachnospiraceae bacterium]|nr:shikimate kinase [Lachnospiraceae bacterium]